MQNVGRARAIPKTVKLRRSGRGPAWPRLGASRAQQGPAGAEPGRAGTGPAQVGPTQPPINKLCLTGALSTHAVKPDMHWQGYSELVRAEPRHRDGGVRGVRGAARPARQYVTFLDVKKVVLRDEASRRRTRGRRGHGEGTPRARGGHASENGAGVARLGRRLSMAAQVDAVLSRFTTKGARTRSKKAPSDQPKCVSRACRSLPCRL